MSFVELPVFLIVRLFLSEESPSQVGLGAQDHLQAKASWLSHPAGTVPDDALPPGFEGGDTTNLSCIRLSDVPVKSTFVLDSTWQVVAGEESEDTEVQNQRELMVLEAVYPRASAIPPNPTFSADLEELRHGDYQVYLIPITPIESEGAIDALLNAPISSQPELLAPPRQRSIPSISNAPDNGKPAAAVLPGVERDVFAAASAAMNKSNEQGSLIDHNLLIKILNNPKLIEKLVQDYGATTNVQNKSKSIASFTPSLHPSPPPVSLSDTSHMHMNRTETKSSSFPATSNGSFYAQPSRVGAEYLPNSQLPPPALPASSAPSAALPQVNAMNYYKNLIQQHGGKEKKTAHQYGNRYGHHVRTKQNQ